MSHPHRIHVNPWLAFAAVGIVAGALLIWVGLASATPGHGTPTTTAAPPETVDSTALATTTSAARATSTSTSAPKQTTSSTTVATTAPATTVPPETVPDTTAPPTTLRCPPGQVPDPVTNCADPTRPTTTVAPVVPAPVAPAPTDPPAADPQPEVQARPVAGPARTPRASAPPADALAGTGTTSAPLVWAGALLVLVGVGLVLTPRLRRA